MTITEKHTYKWKTRKLDAPANEVAKALHQIKGENAGLTPHAVVDAAAEEDHLLHPYFEWDDTKAARLYRVDQARLLIRSISVENKDRSAGPVRAFVSVNGSSGSRSYEPTYQAMEKSDTRNEVLKQAERDWNTFYNKYKNLAALSDALEKAQEALPFQ